VSAKRDAMVGVVLVAAAALAVLGTLWLQGSLMRGDFEEVEAVFSEVGLIRAGNAVKFRGVGIGRVQSITVEPDGERVRVRLRVRSDIQLPSDAVVILSPESMFGDWQAEIQPPGRFPGVRYTEPREDEPDLLPGYALPDVTQLTAAADRISENIEVLTERIGIAFSEETAQNVASLIGNVEEVTERLSDLVSQQATSFTDITAELGAATREIGAAASEARATFRTVNELAGRDELGEALEDLAVVSSNLRGFSGGLEGTNQEIRHMAAQADSTLTRVNRLMASVEDGDGTLGRLLRDPSVAGELEGTLEELQLLLTDIRENPRRYLRLSIF
jgi:phospholipid/cholesterol/gamma-HCH transport system substrate-binding protein